jgi:hypothetical protein
MPTSNSIGYDQDLDPFDQEARIIRKAAHYLDNPFEDNDGLRAMARELILAFQQSAREQKRLMRAGNLQQDQLRLASVELKKKSRLMEEQARYLRLLNARLAQEIEGRKALEVELRLRPATDTLTGGSCRRRFQLTAGCRRARRLRNRRGLNLLALEVRKSP